MIWLAVLVAVLWCGSVGLRWHDMKIYPVISYVSDCAWGGSPREGDCEKHDFVATDERRTSAGDRHQLQLCLRPIIDTAAFHRDGKGGITSLPIEHPYTFALPDENGEVIPLLPPEDERVQRYARELVRNLHPLPADEVRVHDMDSAADPYSCGRMFCCCWAVSLALLSPPG